MMVMTMMNVWYSALLWVVCGTNYKLGEWKREARLQGWPVVSVVSVGDDDEDEDEEEKRLRKAEERKRGKADRRVAVLAAPEDDEVQDVRSKLGLVPAGHVVHLVWLVLGIEFDVQDWHELKSPPPAETCARTKPAPSVRERERGTW
jgi:hypothetical protein